MAFAALAVSGCSAGTQASSASGASAEVSATPTSTPTPTPTAMSNEEAGQYYLAAICPSNLQSAKTTTVVQVKPLDLPAAKAEAAALRDAYRVAIQKLSDEKVLWPEVVKSDVATLAESLYGDLSGAGNVANQTTVANFIEAWNGWESSPAGAATAQKIRLKLGISADTSSSCTTN